MKPTKQELINFLRGIGPLSGRWFGDQASGGAFWWRSYLPILLENDAPQSNDRKLAEFTNGVLAACNQLFITDDEARKAIEKFRAELQAKSLTGDAEKPVDIDVEPPIPASIDPVRISLDEALKRIPETYAVRMQSLCGDRWIDHEWKREGVITVLERAAHIHNTGFDYQARGYGIAILTDGYKWMVIESIAAPQDDGRQIRPIPAGSIVKLLTDIGDKKSVYALKDCLAVVKTHLPDGYYHIGMLGYPFHPDNFHTVLRAAPSEIEEFTPAPTGDDYQSDTIRSLQLKLHNAEAYIKKLEKHDEWLLVPEDFYKTAGDGTNVYWLATSDRNVFVGRLRWGTSRYGHVYGNEADHDRWVTKNGFYVPFKEVTHVIPYRTPELPEVTL